VEQGWHDELLTLGGLYARLWRRQRSDWSLSSWGCKSYYARFLGRHTGLQYHNQFPRWISGSLQLRAVTKKMKQP